MTLWTQPSLLDLLDTVEKKPRPVRFICEACGGAEPTPMKGNNHGLPLMHEGRLHCREMSGALSHLGVYISDYLKGLEHTIHCCAFVHKLPDHGRIDSDGHVVIVLPEDTDGDRMATQRWEHVMHAYQEGLKTWAKHVDAYNVKVIDKAMSFGLNPVLTERLLRSSGRKFAPPKLKFVSAYCQQIEEIGWWHKHVGTLVGERVECTCGNSFEPDHWQYHLAGYPAPTLLEVL